MLIVIRSESVYDDSAGFLEGDNQAVFRLPQSRRTAHVVILTKIVGGSELRPLVIPQAG